MLYLAFLYFDNKSNIYQNISRKITYNFEKKSLMSLIAGHSRTAEEELRNRVKEIRTALLNKKGFCDYLGVGETKARELLHDPGNVF